MYCPSLSLLHGKIDQTFEGSDLGSLHKNTFDTSKVSSTGVHTNENPQKYGRVVKKTVVLMTDNKYNFYLHRVSVSFDAVSLNLLFFFMDVTCNRSLVYFVGEKFSLCMLNVLHW